MALHATGIGRALARDHPRKFFFQLHKKQNKNNQRCATHKQTQASWTTCWTCRGAPRSCYLPWPPCRCSWRTPAARRAPSFPPFYDLFVRECERLPHLFPLPSPFPPSPSPRTLETGRAAAPRAARSGQPRAGGPGGAASSGGGTAGAPGLSGTLRGGLKGGSRRRRRRRRGFRGRVVAFFWLCAVWRRAASPACLLFLRRRPPAAGARPEGGRSGGRGRRYSPGVAVQSLHVAHHCVSAPTPRDRSLGLSAGLRLLRPPE